MNPLIIIQSSCMWLFHILFTLYRFLFLGSDLRIQHLNMDTRVCHNYYTLKKGKLKGFTQYTAFTVCTHTVHVYIHVLVHDMK